MVKFTQDPVALRKVAKVFKALAIMAVVAALGNAIFGEFAIVILVFAGLAILFDIVAGQIRHRANEIEWQRVVAGWDNPPV